MNFFKKLSNKQTSNGSGCCGVEIKEVETTQEESCCSSSDDKKSSCC